MNLLNASKRKDRLPISLVIDNIYFPNIYIVAKEELKFENYNIPILLDDPIADGPMAGIITALKNNPNQPSFVSAADFYDLENSILIDFLKMFFQNHIIFQARTLFP